MRTRTKILTTTAAGALALGAFAAGAAADDEGGARRARNEMHAQMGGVMGTGMMSGDSWESMQAMHDAIDPAAMQQMHDQMVALLPAELRDDAAAMHDEMFPAMTEGSGSGHSAHHPTGS